MIRNFDLPLIDETDDFHVYDLGTMSLHADIALEASMEVFDEDPNSVEVSLTMNENEPGDLREELTTETEAAIVALLAQKGIVATSVTTRESGAHSRDQIIFCVEIQ